MEIKELISNLRKVTKSEGFYILTGELNLIQQLISNGGVRTVRGLKKDGSPNKWIYVRMGLYKGSAQRIKEFISVLRIKNSSYNSVK